MAFEIGDVVKVVNTDNSLDRVRVNSGQDEIPLGSIVVITCAKIGEYQPYSINGGNWYHKEDCFELIRKAGVFRVGNKVRIHDRDLLYVDRPGYAHAGSHVRNLSPELVWKVTGVGSNGALTVEADVRGYRERQGGLNPKAFIFDWTSNKVEDEKPTQFMTEYYHQIIDILHTHEASKEMIEDFAIVIGDREKDFDSTKFKELVKEGEEV